MIRKNRIGILLLLLAGCQSNRPLDGAPAVKLTPFIPTVQASQPITVSTPNLPVEPVVIPTAAPVIHIVALGETISSIALQYNLTMEKVLAANPDTNPNAMIVGDELVIPLTEANSVLGIDPEIIKDVQFIDPRCVNTNDSGWWCSVLVEIVGEQDLENLVVAFSFVGNDGQSVEEKYVSTIMRFAPSGSSIPAVVFLQSDLSKIEQVNCTLFSGQVFNASDHAYLPITVESENISLVGKEATISGKIHVKSENGSGRANIWISAAAFNAGDRLVGVRRLDSEVATNESVDFSLTVYAAEDTIVRVELFAEAY